MERSVSGAQYYRAASSTINQPALSLPKKTIFSGAHHADAREGPNEPYDARFVNQMQAHFAVPAAHLFPGSAHHTVAGPQGGTAVNSLLNMS
jgi:hypothetical protein